MKINWKINIVDLLTLIVVVIGGVLGYVLIELQHKEQSIAITRLTKIQSDIAEIEKAYKEIDSEIGVQKKRTNVTLNITDLISQIQPNLDIQLRSQSDYQENTIRLIWEIRNIGKHTVVMDQVSIYLSRNAIEAKVDSSEVLKKGRDYEIISRLDIGEIPPGQQTFHSWDIQLNMIDKPKRIYLCSKFYTHIHSSIKKMAKNLLGSYLTEAEIDELTKRNFDRHGWLQLK